MIIHPLNKLFIKRNLLEDIQKAQINRGPLNLIIITKPLYRRELIQEAQFKIGLAIEK